MVVESIARQPENIQMAVLLWLNWSASLPRKCDISMATESTESLIQGVSRALDALHGPAAGEPLLLAVSGGADSMALLHLLHGGGRGLGVAHFDHQTREGASTEEGDFVAAEAASLGVPIYRGCADVAALAREASESFEMVARRVRYAFLVKTARSHGYGAIVTGHHGDDQAETVLMRALRGTSPSGLGGIQPIGDVGGIPLLRPLLGFRRVTLEAWLRGEGLAWREDSSNRDTDMVRNRMRHQLLPTLARDFNPRVVDALNRLAEIQRREDALLTRLTAEALGRIRDQDGRIHRQEFCGLDEALQYRVMTEVILDAGGAGTYEIVGRAVRFLHGGETGKLLDIGCHESLLLTRGYAEVVRTTADLTERPAVVLAVPGEVVTDGIRFRCRCLSEAPAGPAHGYGSDHRQIVDGDRLGTALTIRTRKPGDRIAPLGMTGTKKLKDYYNHLGLTPVQRERQLLVVDGDTLVWVVGHAMSGHVAVHEGTTRWVEIEQCPEPTEEGMVVYETPPE